MLDQKSIAADSSEVFALNTLRALCCAQSEGNRGAVIAYAASLRLEAERSQDPRIWFAAVVATAL
jgi:hypothetical protein